MSLSPTLTFVHRFVWRSTWFCLVTFKDHLFDTHLHESNLLTVASLEELPLTHPLRLFLKPFSYRAVEVNQKAVKSLINEGGLVHRLWGFEYEQMVEIFNLAKSNYKFQTLPNLVHPSMAHVDDAIFGLRQDVAAFWRVMRKYVAGFVTIYYADRHVLEDRHVNAFAQRLSVGLNVRAFECSATDAERFIDTVTQLLCAASGMHEHVGQVSDYVSSPEWIGTRLRDTEVCSIQEYVLLLALVCITGMKQPSLMGDWSHLIPKDEHSAQVHALYDEWRADLEKVADEVEARNKTRVYPTMSFNPRCMECSVSV